MTIVNETRLTLTEAAALCSREVQAVRRWIKSGLNGAKLEAAFIGGRLVTSREAVDRFVTATNANRRA